MSRQETQRNSLYREFFQREYAPACRYALSLLGDAHEAEDAVQEVFVKLWEQKPELLGTDGIKYYLLTSVRNKCISVLRTRKGRTVVFTEQSPDGAEEHITEIQHRENATAQERKLADALSQLPPACKDVFLMVKLHGLSYKQAAEQLEISVKTVENQMGKALRIFRDYAQKVSMVAYLFTFLTPGL